MIIDMPAGEVIDRLAILFVKSEMLTDPELKAYSRRAYYDFKQKVKDEIGGRSFNFRLFRVYRMLIKCHKKSWLGLDAQEVERITKDSVKFLGISNALHKLNMIRRDYKNEINQMFDSDFIELSNHPEFSPDDAKNTIKKFKFKKD